MGTVDVNASRSCWCTGKLIAFCWLCVLMFSCACKCVSFDYTSRPWEYLPVWSPHVSLRGKPCVTNTHFRVELIVSFLTWICAHPHLFLLLPFLSPLSHWTNAEWTEPLASISLWKNFQCRYIIYSPESLSFCLHQDGKISHTNETDEQKCVFSFPLLMAN